MKRITLALGILISLLLTSCTIEEGLNGRDGQDGQDGVNIAGTIFEFQDTFTPANEYLLEYSFPTTVEVLETDIVLVYILWGQGEDDNGVPVDIWRLMPQTTLLNQGILQYNFDHTFFDVNIFLEADFDLSTVPAVYTDNQIFRIAVLPADMASGKLNTSNIKEVIGVLGVKEENIVRTK